MSFISKKDMDVERKKIKTKTYFLLRTILSHATKEGRQRREAFAWSSLQQFEDRCCRPSKRWQVHLLQRPD